MTLRQDRQFDYDLRKQGNMMNTSFLTGMVSAFTVIEPASADNFDEPGYLAANPDVRDAILKGHLESGLQHFNAFGQSENRKVRNTAAVSQLRVKKLKKIEPILRKDMAFEMSGDTFNYLTDELRLLGNIAETAAVSANSYNEDVLDIINEFRDGVVLDCGAGQRDVYYDNVVNFEIVNYDTTDVLGIGEALPFKDDSFDAVISIAVLEHVRDPFTCAREISRVLKPGGKLYCSVPLLQPLHGYPHHYYNMTHQGLANLFQSEVDIKKQDVIPSTGPIWSLTWILNRWLAQLPPEAADELRKMTVGELDTNPIIFLDSPWVKELPMEAQLELASATILHGIKKSIEPVV